MKGSEVAASRAVAQPPNGADVAAATADRVAGSSPLASVLVTGASGFLGSAIAAALRASGHQVCVLVRPTSPRTNLVPGNSLCEGDLRDRASLADALKGVRFLFHAAADYRLWARNPEEIVRNNVEGTRLLMEEALRVGVERVVYTSSVATLKPVEGASATEEHRLAEEEAIGAYKRSKVAAERLVEAMIQQDGLPAVIVNPTTPIGPRDVRPTPTGRIIIEAASGRMPGFVDTGLNLAHVDDIAAGHVAALLHGRIGERYILGGENVFLVDMLADIADLVGRRRSRAEDSAGGRLSRCLRGGDDGKDSRRRTLCDTRWPAYGASSYVFRRRESAARARLRIQALPGGPLGRDRLVSCSWAS